MRPTAALARRIRSSELSSRAGSDRHATTLDQSFLALSGVAHGRFLHRFVPKGVDSGFITPRSHGHPWFASCWSQQI